MDIDKFKSTMNVLKNPSRKQLAIMISIGVLILVLIYFYIRKKNKEYEKDRDKVIALSSLRRKIPDDLGKTIYKLIEKVNEISDDKEMLSDSEDDN